MYVEKKKVGNGIYYYLKISKRFGKKVKTKTIAYLGKAPMSKRKLDIEIAKISKRKIKAAEKELWELKEKMKLLDTSQVEELAVILKDWGKKLKIRDKKLKAEMFKDFKTHYIYNSTAIEGNTLSLEETNMLLNENLTPKGKDLKEIYDQINEKECFDYLLSEMPRINIENIVDIHKRLLKNIDIRVGAFRRHNVRVLGAKFDTTDAKYVLTDMRILIDWYKKNKNKLHALELAAIFHEKFERIHPFYDGNGRTGRMIMNLMLIQAGFPPLVIKNKGRLEYYNVLSLGHKVDLTKIEVEGYDPIVNFCYDKLVNTYEEIFSKWG